MKKSMLDSAFENFQSAIADNNVEELKRLLDIGYDPTARFEENGLSSHPRELPPQVLTEPYVRLSPHTALIAYI